MKEVRFVHTADLHLDTPFIGLSALPEHLYHLVEKSTFQAFQNVVQIAIEKRADFIIIAGDLYDGAHRSLRAQSFLKKACEQLKAYGIALFIVHGNHDHLSGSWRNFVWPNNVHFFKGEVECKPFCTKSGASVHLYGFSYEKREVYENMAQFYVKESGASFHIGILHGQAEGMKEHEPYAPFKVSELLEKDFDYWALGHVHSYAKLAENIYYSGNIQGRHIKETGKKGCLFVTLNEGNKAPRVEFLETAAVLWEKATVSITDVTTIDELQQKIESALTKRHFNGRPVLYAVHFTGHGELHSFLLEKEEVREFIAIINEELYAEHRVWIVHYTNDTVAYIDRKEYLQKEDFLSDILHASDRYSSEDQYEIFQELFTHRKGKKYVFPFTKEDFRQIKREAEALILGYLSKKLED